MLWNHDIPRCTFDDGAGHTTEVTVIAGQLGEKRAPSPPPRSWAARQDTDVAIWSIRMQPHAAWTVPPAAHPSTVRTLLARLVEKGALRFEMSANRYVYRAAVTRQRCVRQESRTFLDKVFGGDVNSLLAHFVKEAGLSEEELVALKRLATKNSDSNGK